MLFRLIAMIIVRYKWIVEMVINQFRVALYASLFFCGSSLADETLAGLAWTTARELQEISALNGQVRYVARGVVFVHFEEQVWDQLSMGDFEVLCVDNSEVGDRYFVTDHLDFPLPPGIELVFDGGGEWALLRISESALESVYGKMHFFWPLPDQFSIRGWLGESKGAQKALQTASPVVAALIEEAQAVRLQIDVEALTLKDPSAGSTEGNLRSRFAVHPEMAESTEYIRSELAAALGDEAVELHSFPIGSRRVVSYTSRRGVEGMAPVDTMAHNVIGTLEGSDPEAGYYIICAHYDATGIRSSGGWDWMRDPAPGADDNASGVALVLESARLLAGQRFPWSIRFIAWSGEELGLLGSQDYANIAADRDEKILGVFNFDMIGFNPFKQRLELVTNPGSRWLADEMGAVGKRYAIDLDIDLLVDGGARLSDHAPFWARGYDAILGIENYLPTDSTTYGVREGIYRVNSQYHSVADLPDSINWELMRRTTQLAVATLAQYGLGQGEPNLAVFTGDLRSDQEDDLRVRISNIGLGEVTGGFRVRVSHCRPDSSGCEVIYDEETQAELDPGTGMDLSIPWQRFGEMVFLVEVDLEDQIEEMSEADNRAFQSVRLVPQAKIVVFPNPFRPASGGFLRFSGLPLKARVQLFAPGGELVWEASEDNALQRRLGAKANEVLWRGVNRMGSSDFSPSLVGSGVYMYTIHSREGALLVKDKIAVLR